MFREFFKKKNKPTALDHEIGALAAELGVASKGKPVAPGVARDLLKSLMMRQADLLVRTEEGRGAAVLYKFAARLSGQTVSDALGQGDKHSLLQRGYALMGSGQFEDAKTTLEAAAARYPEHHRVHASLAAVLERLEGEGAALKVMQDFYARKPMKLKAAAQNPSNAPTLMCLYGYDGTRYKLASNGDGSFQKFRRGGHFMLRYLLDKAKFNIHHFTVSNGNLDTYTVPTPCDLIVNTVADPDVEMASLRTIQAFMDRTPNVPIINRPDRVIETTRDRNYERLNKIDGIRFAKTQRFTREGRDEQSLAIHVEDMGYSYPLIVRETGTHTAVSTELVHDRDELARYFNQSEGDSFYAIEFIENASEEGHYTKMRFFYIDGVMYPVVHHIDEVWNVHGSNRKTFMASHPWMLEKEQQFLAEPKSVIGEENYNRLQALHELIGLDFFGVDFTLLADGTILIFELNPAMRHSFTHAKTFSYMTIPLQRISNAFEAMVRKRAEPTFKGGD